MSRRRGSIAGSPLLIGALTTLIVVVAVFLSYNAKEGLPFVPTYDINVELPETSGLQNSNEVRIGGTRIGTVHTLTPHQNPKTGRVTAIAELHLEKSVQPLPADTRAIVQSVSAVGLKYLELEKGTSQQTIKPGGTIPISQVREPVDIVDFFNMFDEKTRNAIQSNTINFGDGLVERGVPLNETIATLRPLLNNAIPVLQNLVSPQTDLKNFFPALDKVASQVAPVAETQAAGFRDLDTVFSAWAGVAPSLERTIEGGAPALKQATYSLAYEAPFVEKTTQFMRLLRPSASSLRTVAPALGHAFSIGAVNLRAATALNSSLAQTAVSFKNFAQNPVVPLGLEALTQTAEIGEPLLAGIAPAQAYCNYITLTFRNLASIFAENVGVGTLARAGIVLSPNGPSAEGFPSSQPANGPSIEREAVAGGQGAIIDNNHLHANPYPNVAGPGQPRLCEAGNEEYVPGQMLVGNLPEGKSATNREITSREENLFGEKYSPEQLRALGLSTSSSKSKSKSSSKGSSSKSGSKSSSSKGSSTKGAS
ncbi:MAG TPA: MlaD family protein [Solirubrobacteraceae bacterium]|nr:MlaD family protein [Solirubrobacteraceae bacterium]